MKKILMIILCMFTIFACGTKKDVDSIVFNIYSAPRSIDPHKFNDTLSIQVSNTLYEGLVKFQDGKIVGAIADSIEKDGNTYKFTLKKDLKYSDGTPLTLEDVRNGFLRVLNKEIASQYASSLFVVKNAKNYYEGKVDASELGIQIEGDKLVITLDKDIDYFLSLLALPLSVPYQDGKYNGPFRLESQEEQALSLVKNENYWNVSNVTVSKLKYVYFNDYSTIANLIQNGDIDISRVDSELIQNKKNTHIDGRIWYLDFNVFNNEKIKNLNLRKAIAHAVDRDIYASKIKNDGSIATYNLIYKDLFKTDVYEPNTNVDINQAISLAKKELNTDKISIELLAGNTPTEVKEIQYIQEQLSSKLGIDVTIKTVPFKERLALIRENKYDIALNTWTPKYKDPVAMLERFAYKNKEITLNEFNQKEYQDLLEKARISSDNRNELLVKLEGMVLDSYIVSPIYFAAENLYLSSKIKTIHYNDLVNVLELEYINK